MRSGSAVARDELDEDSLEVALARLSAGWSAEVQARSLAGRPAPDWVSSPQEEGAGLSSPFRRIRGSSSESIGRCAFDAEPRASGESTVGTPVDSFPLAFRTLLRLPHLFIAIGGD